MATVFLADDLKHSRRVAIKVLRREISTSIGSQRFLQEIDIAAGLKHPHILPVHDSDDTDGLLYYVMPFVEGESLQALAEGISFWWIEVQLCLLMSASRPRAGVLLR